MENNDLQRIWRKLGKDMRGYSKEDLANMLAARTKKAFLRYLFYVAFAIAVSAGFLAFLLIAMINRWGDVYYRANNLFLSIVFVVALWLMIRSVRMLGRSPSLASLRDWLKYRIDGLSRAVKSKTAYFILPILTVFTLLSIHVYYEYKPFLEVIQTGESVYGLIAGYLAGLAVGFFGIFKLKKIMGRQLGRLKDLYRQVCESSEDA